MDEVIQTLSSIKLLKLNFNIYFFIFFLQNSISFTNFINLSNLFLVSGNIHKNA